MIPNAKLNRYTERQASMTQNESVTAIFPALLAGALVVYIGYVVERKRFRLRRIMDIINDEADIKLVHILDQMTRSGALVSMAQAG